MSEVEELRAEVGRISVVARYVPTNGRDARGIESESVFDEVVHAGLLNRSAFIREAIGDDAGPDYTVTRLTVEMTQSVEILAIIAVTYRLLKNFNEVMETLARTRDHLVRLVEWLIYNNTPADASDFLVTGHLATVSADALAIQATQIPPGNPAPVLQAPPALAQPSHVLRQITMPRQPIEWNLDAFLSRLFVPLAFLFGVAGLVVGLVAAFRLI